MSKTRKTDTDRRIGDNIRQIRMSHRMSQTTLADRIGLTFQQVQKYESGANAVASSRIPKICEALEIEPNDLFKGVMNGAPRKVEWLPTTAARMAHDIAKMRPDSQQAMRAVIDAMLRVGGETE